MVDERGNVFGSPYRCARAELERLGKAPSAATLPPCAFANGDDGKDLRQTKKAGSGYERMILRHNMFSEVKVNFGQTYRVPMNPYRRGTGYLQAFFRINRRFSGFADGELVSFGQEAVGAAQAGAVRQCPHRPQ